MYSSRGCGCNNCIDVLIIWEPRQKPSCLHCIWSSDSTPYFLHNCMIYYFHCSNSRYACVGSLGVILTCAKIYLSFKKTKNCTFDWLSVYSPPLDLSSRFYNSCHSFGLHYFGLITIGERWMCVLWEVLDVECLFLMESTINLGGMKFLTSLMNLTWESMFNVLMCRLLIRCPTLMKRKLTCFIILEPSILSFEDYLKLCLFVCKTLNVPIHCWRT